MKLLPLYATYIVMLGQAAWSKFHGDPTWFEKQFSQTALNFFPGAVTAQFYTIALVELLLTIGWVVSFCLGEFRSGKPKPLLKCSLLGCCFLFAALSLGLRITGDFTGASQVFIYFIGSFGFFELLQHKGNDI